jgi:hypothetical protein
MKFEMFRKVCTFEASPHAIDINVKPFTDSKIVRGLYILQVLVLSSTWYGQYDSPSFSKYPEYLGYSFNDAASIDFIACLIQRLYFYMFKHIYA